MAPTAESAWRMSPPTVEGVQLCLRNARRLRADAHRCRSPARLALFELSLEQAALAGMLLFRMEVDEARRAGALDLDGSRPPVPPGKAVYTDFLAEHSVELDDKSIDRAFHRHHGSLSELKFVLDLIESLLPKVLDPSTPIPPSARRVPTPYRFVYRVARTGKVSALVSRYIARLMNGLRGLDIVQLDNTVKNNSLYARVDLTTGAVTIPTLDEESEAVMARASVAVERFVTGLLMGRQHGMSLPWRSASGTVQVPR